MDGGGSSIPRWAATNTAAAAVAAVAMRATLTVRRRIMPDCSIDGLVEIRIRTCQSGSWIEGWVLATELCAGGGGALAAPSGGCCGGGGKDAAKEAAIKLAGEKNWPAKELIAVLKALGS